MSIRTAFVWDYFGPLHHDRLKAVSEIPGFSAIGIELVGKSITYGWERSTVNNDVVTLFPDISFEEMPNLSAAINIVRVCLRERIDHIFLCHYDNVSICMAAYLLRILSKRVYFMGCPRFEDAPRSAARELAKFPFLLPYNGALVGSSATAKYLKFLGKGNIPIEHGYNTVSRGRLLRDSEGMGQRNRQNFIVVARLVDKKNIDIILRAFSIFKKSYPDIHHTLTVCGDGPLEGALKDLASNLGISKYVEFTGFIQSQDVARMIAGSCALVLMSSHEQFGNVLAEAVCLGVPLLVSSDCGGHTELLRPGHNGFLLHPRDDLGLASAMGLLATSPKLAADMAEASSSLFEKADVHAFSKAVSLLVSR